MHPREVESEVWAYYRKTSPSLQEFYSRYTPEWEAFYAHESLLPSDFLSFLKGRITAFRKRYSLFELDVLYYIDRLEQLPLIGEERKQVQELFLDKWHQLLTAKEYDYQYHHIDALCNEFILLGKKYGLKTANAPIGSRIQWLLLNHPTLYQQLVPYEKEMEKNRQIRELVRVLGKRSKGEKRSFEAFDGIHEELLVQSAVLSDIEGITVGNDLNHLLPVEYCYLSDEALYPEFVKRYVEKQLQVFDSRSVENTSAIANTKKPVSSQGPFIVCIDTSGSMQGRRERLSKSALLAVARLVEQTHRKCYVINFAEDIECLLLQELKTDLPLLTTFLQRRFDGGTDILPALREAVRMVKTNGWQRSDIVMISDFEMPPASEELMVRVHQAQLYGTSFYALVFGGRPEMDYLRICEKYWDMEIP